MLSREIVFVLSFVVSKILKDRHYTQFLDLLDMTKRQMWTLYVMCCNGTLGTGQYCSLVLCQRCVLCVSPFITALSSSVSKAF